MHVDFLHNQRNTNICICMAFRERLGLTQYLCTYASQKGACMKSDEWRKVHRYLTIL